MSRQRHPFRGAERDTRCDKVIEWYLNNVGIDSGVECSAPFGSHDEADDHRLSLRRAGNHYGVSVAAWVTGQNGESCWEDCPDPGGPHRTHLRVHSKERGQAHIAREAAGDIRNARYNPFLRGQARSGQRRGR